MQRAVTRYAGGEQTRIAYQVIGQGSLDLILVPGFPSNLEIMWEDPGYSRLVKRLSAFCRLILFDPRGRGLSDAVDHRKALNLTTTVDDIRSVMDAAGCGRAALMGVSDGAPQAMLFAAKYPERMRALVLFGGYASFKGDVMDARRVSAHVETVEAAWGSGATLARFAPSRVDNQALSDWWGRLERLSASPSAAGAHSRLSAAVDVRDDLQAIATPTLLLHRTEDAYVPVKSSRELASVVQDARVVELPGRDHPVWMGDVDTIADLVEEFLTGEPAVPHGDRVLGALMVARLGTPSGISAGRHFQERVMLLREALPRVMAGHSGKAQWSGPERIDATFSSVASAARCALALRETAASLGLAISQGIHAGEIDKGGDTLSGLVLDVAASFATAAKRDDILMSRLASELISGSGLQFVDRGTLLVENIREPLPIVAVARERHLEPQGGTKSRSADLSRLSQREREVLGLVAQGQSNPHIAVQLGLSEHTVKRHVANLLLKLEMPTRAAAAGLFARGPEE